MQWVSFYDDVTMVTVYETKVYSACEKTCYWLQRRPSNNTLYCTNSFDEIS